LSAREGSIHCSLFGEQPFILFYPIFSSRGLFGYNDAMIADKQESLLIPAPSWQAQWLSWLSWLLTAVLLGVGLWYILQKVTLVAMWSALVQAQLGYVLAALLVILATLWLKAWRWQYLFVPDGSSQTQPLAPLFWSMMLGQYVNLMIPFFRLGEVARLLSLDQQTGVGKARTLGTLVVEKTLDILMLVLTIAIILPFIVLPDFVSNPFTLGLIGGLTFLGLYLLAYQTHLIIRLSRRLIRPLPAGLHDRLLRLIISGLEGLAALRRPRLTLILLLQSLLIAILAVLTPYLLFHAFNIPLGLAEAALINVVVMVVSTPPSTPARIGVFDGTVSFMLFRFGLAAEAVIVSYTIIFHLVVMLPQIVLGSAAISRTNWRWPNS
jgi:glycosyltransferase 2 family protein